MKRVCVLCAALFCAALSAQEIGVPVETHVSQHGKTDAAVTHDAAGDVKAAWSEAVEAGSAQAVEAGAHQPDAAPAVIVPAIPVPIAVAPPAPIAAEPELPLTRADSALGVYRSARDAIIGVNRKFPRPPRPGQPADTVRASRAPDAALASADETITSAWVAMGVYQPPRQRPLAVVPPHAPVKTAAQAAPPVARPFKAQAALGFLVPVNPAGEVNFRPWWNMGYYASYREIDADAQFSKGFGVDLSLYTFSKKEYRKYYESKTGEEKREIISISDAAPMLIIDVGYYMKLYPANRFKIPYFSGSVGVCGAFGGGAKASYKEFRVDAAAPDGYSGYPVEGIEENMIEDVYVLGAAVGVGADYPVYAGIRVFADVNYSLRLGLYSMFKDGEYLGGLVPQIPIKFGVLVPFSAISELIRF